MPSGGAAPGPFPASGEPAQAAAPRPSNERCARCGVDNPPSIRFCRMCGNQLQTPEAAALAPPPGAPQAAPRAVPCPRCGTSVDRGASFCGVCGLPSSEMNLAPPGSSLPAPALPPAPAPPQAHAPVLAQAPVPAQAPAMAPTPAPPSVVVIPPPGNAPSPPAMAAPVAPMIPTVRPAQVQGTPDSARYDARTDNFGAASVQGVPQLVTILKDGSEGPTYRLTNTTTDIGRFEGNVTLPDDPYLSPRHARIARRNDRYYLRDLGSVNGIFYRIREPAELHHGDVLLVGQQVLRVEVLTDAETSLGPVMHYGVMLFGTPETPRMMRLVQLTSEGIPRDVYHLYRDETVLGRESGDIVFTDDVFLSRRHVAFRLDRQQRRLVVRDLGSSNGTLVLFRGEREVTDGDLFRIGHHLFRFDASPRGGNGAPR